MIDGKFNEDPKLRPINKIEEKRHKHLPKLRPYLKCRTWWKEPPTGPDEGSNSLKMSLSQPPTFWTSIPIASAYSKSLLHKLIKCFNMCYVPLSKHAIKQ